jgi:hypothetical protein
MRSWMQKLSKMSHGDLAWIALLAGVAAYDYWAAYDKSLGRDTLSQSFDRALADPVRRWPTTLVWAALTAHLFDRYLKRNQ